MIASAVDSIVRAFCMSTIAVSRSNIHPRNPEKERKRDMISGISTVRQKIQISYKCVGFSDDDLGMIAVTHLNCFSFQIAPSRSLIVRTFYRNNEWSGIKSIEVIDKRNPIRLLFSRDIDGIRVMLTYLNQRYSTSPFWAYLPWLVKRIYFHDKHVERLKPGAKRIDRYPV